MSPVSAQIDALVSRLAQRKLYGSYQCAIETIICLRNFISALRWKDVEGLLSELSDINERLLQAQPIEIAVDNTMQRIFHLIREEYASLTNEDTPLSMSLDHISDPPSRRRRSSSGPRDRRISLTEDYGDSGNLKASIIQGINDLKDELENSRSNIAAQAHEHIHSNEIILTLGKSKTVELFLKESARYRKFQVIVIETAPSFQGHSMAASLADIGIETTVIPDSAAFAVMSRVSKVIMSAHAVKANGGLITMSGSLVVATAAKHYSTPVVVCSGLYKLSPFYPFDIDEFISYVNPDPVLPFSDDKIDQVTVLNPYFDYISPEMISLYITNIGPHPPSYMHHLVADYYGEATF